MQPRSMQPRPVKVSARTRHASYPQVDGVAAGVALPLLFSVAVALVAAALVAVGGLLAPYPILRVLFLIRKSDNARIDLEQAYGFCFCIAALGYGAFEGVWPTTLWLMVGFLFTVRARALFSVTHSQFSFLILQAFYASVCVEPRDTEALLDAGGIFFAGVFFTVVPAAANVFFRTLFGFNSGMNWACFGFFWFSFRTMYFNCG